MKQGLELIKKKFTRQGLLSWNKTGYDEQTANARGTKTRQKNVYFCPVFAKFLPKGKIEILSQFLTSRALDKLLGNYDSWVSCYFLGLMHF